MATEDKAAEVKDGGVHALYDELADIIFSLNKYGTDLKLDEYAKQVAIEKKIEDFCRRKTEYIETKLLPHFPLIKAVQTQLESFGAQEPPPLKVACEQEFLPGLISASRYVDKDEFLTMLQINYSLNSARDHAKILGLFLNKIGQKYQLHSSISLDLATVEGVTKRVWFALMHQALKNKGYIDRKNNWLARTLILEIEKTEIPIKVEEIKDDMRHAVADRIEKFFTDAKTNPRVFFTQAQILELKEVANKQDNKEVARLLDKYAGEQKDKESAAKEFAAKIDREVTAWVEEETKLSQASKVGEKIQQFIERNLDNPVAFLSQTQIERILKVAADHKEIKDIIDENITKQKQKEEDFARALLGVNKRLDQWKAQLIEPDNLDAEAVIKEQQKRKSILCGNAVVSIHDWLRNLFLTKEQIKQIREVIKDKAIEKEVTKLLDDYEKNPKYLIKNAKPEDSLSQDIAHYEAKDKHNYRAKIVAWVTGMVSLIMILAAGLGIMTPKLASGSGLQEALLEVGKFVINLISTNGAIAVGAILSVFIASFLVSVIIARCNGLNDEERQWIKCKREVEEDNMFRSGNASAKSPTHSGANSPEAPSSPTNGPLGAVTISPPLPPPLSQAALLRPDDLYAEPQTPMIGRMIFEEAKGRFLSPTPSSRSSPQRFTFDKKGEARGTPPSHRRAVSFSPESERFVLGPVREGGPVPEVAL